MLTNSELKKNARQTLRGHWQRAIKLTIVPVILTLLSAAYKYSNVSWLHTNLAAREWYTLFNVTELVMAFGIIYTLLDWVRNTDIINQSLPGRIFGLSVNTVLALTVQLAFMSFIVSIGMLIIIPGIIFILMFSQSVYIYKDQHETDPKMGAWEGVINSVSLSESMMVGHKWEFFKLNLSFLGWLLLSIATLGIEFIWLAPYYQLTMAGYYDALAAENRALIAQHA